MGNIGIGTGTAHEFACTDEEDQEGRTLITAGCLGKETL